MSYGQGFPKSRCVVRKQHCVSETGVKRETFQIIVQCGKGRLKAEILRAKIEDFLRRPSSSGESTND